MNANIYYKHGHEKEKLNTKGNLSVIIFFIYLNIDEVISFLTQSDYLMFITDPREEG